jgi:uncharacterized phage protein gp47/JayE
MEANLSQYLAEQISEMESNLPKYLEGQTFETILQRMLDRMPPELDKSEGGPIYSTQAPTALELTLFAICAKMVLDWGFTQTTHSKYLDWKGAEMGVPRRPATHASTFWTIVGESGIVISVNTLGNTPSTDAAPAVFFRTTQEVEIGQEGVVDVLIEAVEAGAAGNVAAGTITLLTEPIQGVISVINHQAATGGLDEEDDESYRNRILEAADKDEGDGNISDYEIWAKEVPGVGYVLVDPLWQGPNTVRVVILDQDGSIPSANLVDAVQEYLDPGRRGRGEGRAPIGDKVTVQAPTEVELFITIPSLVVESGYTAEQAKENLITAARMYIISVSPGGIIRIKDLEAAIAAAPGVLDFGDILINGLRENVKLAVDEKASLAGVIYA